MVIQIPDLQHLFHFPSQWFFLGNSLKKSWNLLFTIYNIKHANYRNTEFVAPIKYTGFASKRSPLLLKIITMFSFFYLVFYSTYYKWSSSNKADELLFVERTEQNYKQYLDSNYFYDLMSLFKVEFIKHLFLFYYFLFNVFTIKWQKTICL